MSLLSSPALISSMRVPNTLKQRPLPLLSQADSRSKTASLVENGMNRPAVTRKNDRNQTHPRPHRVSVSTGQASSCPVNRPAPVSQWLRLITTDGRAPAHHCAAPIRQCATPLTLPCIFWPFRAGRSNGATGGLQRASLRGNADPTVHLPRAG